MATPMMPRPKKPTFGLPSGLFDAEILHGWNSLVILRGLAERNGTIQWPWFVKNFRPKDRGADPEVFKDDIDSFWLETGLCTRCSKSAKQDLVATSMSFRKAFIHLSRCLHSDQLFRSQI